MQGAKSFTEFASLAVPSVIVFNVATGGSAGWGALFGVIVVLMFANILDAR